jgi:rhodanese-related sulfurtransferase
VGKNKEIRTVITYCGLFAGISKKAFIEIARFLRRLALPPENTVFRQGHLDDEFCILISGAVKGFITDGKDDVHGFVHLGAGESFGKLVLLTEKSRPFSGKTVEKTRPLSISKAGCTPIPGISSDVSAAIGSRVAHGKQKARAAVAITAARRYEARRVLLRDLLIVAGFSIICALVFNGSNPKGITFFDEHYLDGAVSFVTPLKAFEKQKKHEVIFVDAMPTGYYEQKHIGKAVSLPLEIFDIMYDMSLSREKKGKEIIVYGRTISKRYDVDVANKLVIRGHEDVRVLAGGLAAWKKGGFPVE